MLHDYPKLQCPFIRKSIPISKDDFKKWGRKFNLRTPEVYLAQNEVNPGYEWVFNDKDTIAVEKLDGTNIMIRTENGSLVEIQNRLNVIDPLKVLNVSKSNIYIIEGIFNSVSKGYLKNNETQVGELLGPKLNGNPLELLNHVWYPFERAIGTLCYKSFNSHEPTYENLESWFVSHLKSLLYGRVNNLRMDEHSIMAEGVVFYNLKRKAEQKTWRAKLRRDMFESFYSPEIRVLK